VVLRRRWRSRQLAVGDDAVVETGEDGRTHTVLFSDLLLVHDRRRLLMAHCGHDCATDVTAFARKLRRIEDRLPARAWRYTYRRLRDG
jgi:hypothetical protein